MPDILDTGNAPVYKDKTFKNFKQGVESTVEGVRTGFQESVKSGAEAFGEFREDLLNTPFPFAPSIADQMKALRELIGFPKETSVGEKALGFGVGSIKGVGGIPKGLQLNRLLGEQRKKIANRPFLEFLEDRAIEIQGTKPIPAQLKEIQKQLDKKLVKEVKPGAVFNRLQETKAKGINKITAVFHGETQSFGVEFRSGLKPVENPEFVIVEREDKHVVITVDFNSRLINHQLAPVFRQQFKNNHVADLTDETPIPSEFRQTPPDNFSVFRANNFEDAVIMINKMLELAKEPETVGVAAVKVGDKIFKSSKGRTHGDAFNKAEDELGIEFNPSAVIAGFITSTGRFITRTEALDIAKKSKQIGFEIKNRTGLDTLDIEPDVKARFEGSRITDDLLDE